MSESERESELWRDYKREEIGEDQMNNSGALCSVLVTVCKQKKGQAGFGGVKGVGVFVSPYDTGWSPQLLQSPD